MYTIAKIIRAQLIKLVFLCLLLCPALAFSAFSEKKITSDLRKAGYETKEITQKTIPMSNQNYFIIKVSKDGENFKVKVFNDKYFISGKHGKLEPLRIPQRGVNARIGTEPQKKADIQHLTRPGFSQDKTFQKKNKNTDEAGSSQHLDRESGNLNKGGKEFLANAEPTIRLGSDSNVSNASDSFNNGCYPVSFSRVASFGLGMNDTAKVLNSLSHKGGDQNMKLDRKALDPSKDFKKSGKDSSTDQIFKRAGNGKNDPVSKSQKDLYSGINSKEMHTYTMKQVWGILQGEKISGRQTPDRMLAQKSLTLLVKSMLAQGKSKKEVYSLLNRQMKKQFSGSVLLSGKDPQKPWVLKPDGSLKVYALANNRDQVLSYTAQALTLKNDPIYNAKRSQWMNANKELDSLKRNVTFQSDHSQIRDLETKINNLSREITSRQQEIFS